MPHLPGPRTCHLPPTPQHRFSRPGGLPSPPFGSSSRALETTHHNVAMTLCPGTWVSGSAETPGWPSSLRCNLAKRAGRLPHLGRSVVQKHRTHQPWHPAPVPFPQGTCGFAPAAAPHQAHPSGVHDRRLTLTVSETEPMILPFCR